MTAPGTPALDAEGLTAERDDAHSLIGCLYAGGIEGWDGHAAAVETYKQLKAEAAPAAVVAQDAKGQGMKHLWEVDHPYYCGEATWYKVEDHQRWNSWTDFRENTIFVTGDRDMNLLFRWDWHSWRRHPDPIERYDTDDELELFFVLQRKPMLVSHAIAVTDDDESEIRAWLTECAATIRTIWEPIELTPAAVVAQDGTAASDG